MSTIAELRGLSRDELLQRYDQLSAQLEACEGECRSLRTRSAAFEAVFQKSLDVNIVVDDRELTILYMSESVETYLGYAPYQLLGKSFPDLFPDEEEGESEELQFKLRTFDSVIADQSFLHENGRIIHMDLTASTLAWSGRRAILINLRSTEERRRAEAKQNQLVTELEEALSRVKLLSGFLPICAHCKRIRDDQGYWSQVEEYIRANSEAEFSHGICPDCSHQQYAQIYTSDM